MPTGIVLMPWNVPTFGVTTIELGNQRRSPIKTLASSLSTTEPVSSAKSTTSLDSWREKSTNWLYF